MRGWASRYQIETTVASIELRAEALARLSVERPGAAREAVAAAATFRTYRAGIEAECAAALALCRACRVPIPTTKVQHDRRKSGAVILPVGVLQKPDSDPEAD